MKLLVVILIFLLCGRQVAAGVNPLSTEIKKKCRQYGICRIECYQSEMLIAYCAFYLECCVKGNPEP
ncbi:beta-defensin 134 [Erinaceus europaeus]|uniref:Beta-defensin 134 n=1 Tax=Erinaceus europaeus TaxID=9365 RepID=A0A1S3W415_ERIEU|nr:beta-defensin 134 [Erinaceus europaeus]